MSTLPDFTLLQQTATNCIGPQSEEIDIDNCDYLARLTSGLKYYSLLNISDNELSHDIFTQFCNDIYSNLLNDYNHTITIHSNQLEAISSVLIKSNLFSKCDINLCSFNTRHYNNNRRQINDKKEDAKFRFFREIFDNVHNFVFHLFDLGLRIRTNIKQKNDVDNGDTYDVKSDVNNGDIDGFDFIDNEFSKHKQMIQYQREKSGLTNYRYENENNKFNIQVSNDKKDDTDYGFDVQKDRKNTFIDAMMKYIVTEDSVTVQQSHYNRLKHFLNDEKYDSDAVVADLTDYNDKNDTQYSNIAVFMHNNVFMSVIKQYHQQHTDANQEEGTLSFNVGVTFYYSPWYKEQFSNCTFYNEQIVSFNQLYVEQKHNTFKHEILCHLNIDEYNDVVLKSDEYINCEKVKQIKCDTDQDALHCNIKKGEPISIKHLKSIMLYCDYTTLCTSFSATFRAIKRKESLQSIKKRNREYWWMSKYLQETVQYFGETGTLMLDFQQSDFVPSPPIFSGLSCVMVVPSFMIPLKSPTSTSKQISIAMKFGTTKGMVIQFSQNGGMMMGCVKSFNCSWISRYSEEDEQLFFGCRSGIRIESIFIMNCGKNYQVFVHSLYILDCMLNGRGMTNRDVITNKDIKIIKKLMSGHHKFDNYVVDTFKTYCNNKNRIYIDLHYLEMYFGKIHHLIMESVEKIPDSIIVDQDSNQNLFRTELLNTFNNVNGIMIQASVWNDSWPFSLISLLKIVDKSSSLKEIRIQSGWIGKLWSTSESIIKSKYNQKKKK
eukprot:440542_1